MPVLKTYKNGVWEPVSGMSGMADGGNADTLDGKHADEFATASDIEAIQTKIGNTSVAEQISTALTEANTYTDTKTSGLATENYVDNKVADMVDSAPETLNTLNELAAALGDDPNFATTVATQIGGLETKVGDKKVSEQIVEAIVGKANSSDLSAHTGNKSNPHGVTAAQAGALPTTGGTLTGDITVPNLQSIKFTSAGSPNANPAYVATFYNNDSKYGLSFSSIAELQSKLNIPLPIRLQEYQASNGVVTDPNNATKTGFYYINGTINRPSFSQSANNDYRILTTAYGDNWLQQIATDFRCNDIFYRRKENNQWRSWVRIYPTAEATTSSAGLMSSADKIKLNDVATGANKTVVDDALSSTSTNPVQNKVVNTAISGLNTLVGNKKVFEQITEAISTHNENENAHADIREQISQLSSKKVVLFSEQNLADEERTQARANIAAASVGDIPSVLHGIGDSETAVMSQKAVSDAIASLTALPYGGSKEWLEKNGDKSQLYQINGYVWGYIESTGWTQSGTQFLVVTHEAYMTNNGGIPYLLRPSDAKTGIVFSYTEASGDSDTPVYDALPESANEGDIVAVGDRKYKASLNTVTVEHNAYDPNTAKFNWRLNSTGAEKELGGSLLLDYAEVTYNTNFVVTIKGIEKLVKNYSSYLLVDYYDADKNRLGYVAGAAFYVPGGGGSDVLGNIFSGTLPVTFRLFAYSTGNVNNIETTKYVRIKLGIATDGTTISAADCEGLVVNFPSMNATKTEVTWTDIGEYIPPVEAGWSATDETYSVIDTLSVSANSGDIAVYSADGYVYSYINGSAWSQTSKYDDAIGSMLVDGKSAYKYATEGGYTGTEAEFAKDINPDNIKSELSQIEAPTIVSSVTKMTDTTKHYVLDGYIYQYQITANGAQEWVNTGLSYMPIFKTDLIGVLTENNVIYLSDNSLPSGTYTLKYGDETYATIGTITVE